MKIPTWIVCPETKNSLTQDESTLSAGEKIYPFINQIPWLYKNPEYYFLEWSTKIEAYLKQEEQYLSSLQLKINLAEKQLTKKRISQIHEAKTKNLKLMKKLLLPFQGHQPIAISQSTQQIYSYFQLIFRDWSWGGEEVKAYEQFVAKNIQPDQKRILILGAGACGLSYYLANHFPDKEIVSLDHNPFLFFIAQKIFDGQEVKLSDFSFYPQNSHLSSQQHKIKCHKLESQNHYFVLSRFPDLPFQEKSFDVIIAPWFFDILETPFIESVKYTLNYLNPEGSLLIYGPNNVHKNNILEQMTSDELGVELAELFTDFSQEVHALKYLESPLEAQQRIENVQFICGKKLKEPTQKYALPVDKKTFFYGPQVEQYKAFNATFYQILKHINKDITPEELAPLIQKEFQFTPEEASYYAQTILDKLTTDIYK